MKDLYKQYSRLMYATALRSVPSREDCEDIVQDAVESLCRKVHTLMGLPGPAYIVHTVKSKVRNFQRHQNVVNRHVTALAEFLRCKPDSVRMRLTRAKRKAMALMNGGNIHIVTSDLTNNIY